MNSAGSDKINLTPSTKEILKNESTEWVLSRPTPLLRQFAATDFALHLIFSSRLVFGWLGWIYSKTRKLNFWQIPRLKISYFATVRGYTSAWGCLLPIWRSNSWIRSLICVCEVWIRAIIWGMTSSHVSTDIWLKPSSNAFLTLSKNPWLNQRLSRLTKAKLEKYKLQSFLDFHSKLQLFLNYRRMSCSFVVFAPWSSSSMLLKNPRTAGTKKGCSSLFVFSRWKNWMTS